MLTQNKKGGRRSQIQIVLFVGLFSSLFTCIHPLQAENKSNDLCNKALSCYSTMVSNYGNKDTIQLAREKRLCDRLKEKCEHLKKTNKKSSLTLQQAYDAYQQAFKLYTLMVTTSSAEDPADVQNAPENYRSSYAQYKELKDALQGATNKPKKSETLDTTGIDGIVDIDPSDVENNIKYIERLRKRNQPPISENLSQNKKTKNNTVTADQYHYGIGVEPDQYKAFELYKNAARKGDINAMIELSDFYEQGVWVKQSHSKAKQLLQKSANMGSLIAKWQLELIDEKE